MGRKTTDTISFTLDNGENLFFPVATITGSRPGPTAVITAGIHGCEYPGIVAAIKFFKETSPEEVKGEIKIITITSSQAFEARSMFVTPSDQKNPNRVFPGNPHGSYSEVLACKVMEIVTGSDYHIDLHGGDMVEMLDPFSLYHKFADKRITDASHDIAYYYGLPNIVMTEKGGLWPDDGTTYANIAEKLNIPSAIVEVGAMGVLDRPSVERHISGMRNVLRKFGSLDGEVFEIKKPSYFNNMSWLYTTHKGIFYLKTDVGNEVTAGDPIGELEDYFGNHIETIKSDVNGKVLFLTGNPAMKEHGLVAGIGVSVD